MLILNEREILRGIISEVEQIGFISMWFRLSSLPEK